MAGERAKKVVAGIYSATAKRVYEPLVVHGSFRLLGGPLNELVADQGRRAVETARGTPILDVPVGTAYFTRRVAALHPGLVVGADIAAGMVRESADVARRDRLTNLRVVQADAHRLPFPDGTFEAILCTNGLQVMPGLRAAVRELARVLAPTGVIFVSVVGVPLRSRRLPTAFATGRVDDELARAGLHVVGKKTVRLATLYEATKA